MIFLGIDPGLEGAVAAIGPTGRPLGHQPTPTLGKSEHDVEAMRRVLLDHQQAAGGDLCVYLEDPGRVVRTPGGIRPATVLRESVCLWRGLCVGLGIPVRLVSPARWQRSMHAGTPADEDRKVRSVLAVRQLWGGINLRRTERCRKDSDGIAEGYLLAEFGRRERAGRTGQEA